MKIARELRKPSNWQDFERLCCEIWKVIWKDPEAKLHGRSGQEQQGVDIFGHNNEDPAYSGVQCKRYDKLTQKIIDEEIENATKFEPALKHLVMATTASRDASIEKYIRKKDVENRENGLFGISIMEWEDIVEILEQYPSLLNWYDNSIGIWTATSIQVGFSTGSDVINICPKFLENVFYHEDAYSYKKLSKNTSNLNQIHPFAYQYKMVEGERNLSYVPINIRIDNIGLSAIETVNVIFTFPETVSIKSSNERHDMPFLKTGTSNTYIDENLNCAKIIVQNLLPNRGVKVAPIYVKPDSSIKEFEINWDFSSNNFTKKGKLKVTVNPDIIQEYVRTQKDVLPPNEIIDYIEDIT